MNVEKRFAVALLMSQGSKLVLDFTEAQNEQEALGKSIIKNWDKSPVVAFNVKPVEAKAEEVKPAEVKAVV